MNLTLRHDPVWLGSVHPPDGSCILLGGDGHQVAVPAPFLLAVSPLVRSLLSDLLSPAYCPCFISLPVATGEVLQAVRDILTTGKVAAGYHVDDVEEVRQVLGILGVEARLVSYQIESIQVGQVFDSDVKEEFSNEGPQNSYEEEKVKVEVTVKIEDRENINVEAESNKLRQSFAPKSCTSENSVPKMTTISCTHCSDKFASRSLLSKHIEFVQKPESFDNVCPKTFALKQTLKQQIKSSPGKEEITCNLCSKKFTKKGGLVTHIKSIHEQIKIKCNLCPLTFSEKRNLNQHMNSFHYQIKVECHICSQKFTQKQGLTRHIKAVHDQIRMQCNLCPQKFASKYGLKVHINSVHKQIKIQCSLCFKKFTQKAHLATHIQAVHGQI